MTDQENQKPTIEERYAVAIMAGIPDGLIMAAGLQRERVGVLLLRLRAEYDAVRAQMERAGEIAPSAADRVRSLVKEADRMKALAKRLGLTNVSAASEALERAADLQREIAGTPKRAERDIKTARAVILVALTSLQDARQELGALAVRMGANPKRALAPAVALQLAGRVLDVWLDETCHTCDGTGLIGSQYQGGAERPCSTCKGSGHRRDIIGRTDLERMFAGDLLAEVQRQVAAAAAGIKAAIHAESGPSEPIHPELARRLAELRGAEAAAD